MSSSAQVQIEVGQAGLLDALQDQFGSVPWWMISALVHGAVLVLMMLLMVATVEVEAPPIETDIVRPPMPEDPLPAIEPIKTMITDNILPVEAPVIPVEEPEIVETMQTANDSPEESAEGQLDAIAEVQMGHPGAITTMGITGLPSGRYSRPGPGGNLRAALKGGGSRVGEEAVKAGLKWLARHQTEAGNWEIGRWGGTKSEVASVGVTGLGLLAFLGAGYSESIETDYTQTIIRATRWLMSQQAEDGSIGQRGAGSNGAGYNHPIAGLALAEAYGMGGNLEVGLAAQRALDYSVNVHVGPDGGWRYSPGQAGDLSVTGWFAMQFKSASIAGLRVDPKALDGLKRFLKTVTSSTDDTQAPYPGLGAYTVGSGYSAPMTSVAMFCFQAIGAGRDSPELLGGAEFLMKHLPSWDRGGKHDYYYWYYGTMALFQMKGEHWTRWNAAMLQMLVERQHRTSDNLELHGSWDPHGFSAEYGGRALSTALAVLTLEVYYRYEAIYGGGS